MSAPDDANEPRPGEAPSQDPPQDAPAETAETGGSAEPEATEAQAPEAQAAEAQATAASKPTNPRVRIETSEGTLLIELLEEVAPRTTAHFLQLVHDGFYDGRTFHRVVPEFIIQGGCPYHDGTGGCGYTINPEFNDTPHEKGTVSMARTADPYSASSQFFICLNRENCAHLDGQYTAFAKVVKNLDVLDRLADVPLTNYELGAPADPPMIYQIYREEDPHAHYDPHYDDHHHDHHHDD